MPMMETANRIPFGSVDPLILHIYPDTDGVESESVLFEDEGETHITLRKDGSRLKLHWNTSLQRTLSFRIHPWGGLDDVPEGPLLTGQNGSFELEAA